MKMKLLGCLLLLAPGLFASISVNVSTYGAKGDGATDDTTAIVKASTAVANSGGVLYFPAGTYMINPNEGHLVLGSNMTVVGPGVIKVMPNTGNFEYIMAPNPYYKVVSNVRIQNLTVDENVLNNPSVVGGSNGAQIILLGVEMNQLTLWGSTFYTSGTWAVKVNDQLTMTGNRIVFENRSDQSWYDNSAIFFAAQHNTCSITNNSFEGTTQSANTAIEVHYSQNCTISGNTFDMYRQAVLPMDSYALSITGNTITNAEFAISLWAVTTLENVTVSNNSIAINNLDRQTGSAAGIDFYWCSYCSPIGNFYNINIQNNKISFQREVRTNVSASSYWGIGVMPAGDVNQVTISGNTITNAPIRAITIGNSMAPNVTSNVTVENNTIISPGTNTDETYSLAGIALQGHLSNVVVNSNIITNQWTPFTGRYGLWSDPNGSYTGVSLSGNTIGSVYTNVVSSQISN